MVIVLIDANAWQHGMQKDLGCWRREMMLSGKRYELVVACYGRRSSIENSEQPRLAIAGDLITFEHFAIWSCLHEVRTNFAFDI